MRHQTHIAGDVSFRTAIPDDATTVRDLVRKYYEYDGIQFDENDLRTGLADLLDDSSLGQVWLVLSAKQAIGYVIFTYGFDIEFGGRLATITDLYLEPEHRGRGIGFRLLEHVEEFCRSNGLRGLELQVETDNTEARGLYTKFGFTGAERIPMSKRIKS
jgi:ribosomal protein S18 acetylase RimI-like enzyme